MVNIRLVGKTPMNESEMKTIESTDSPIAVLTMHLANNKSLYFSFNLASTFEFMILLITYECILALLIFSNIQNDLR